MRLHYGLLLFVFAACNSPFPQTSKPNIPGDHTKSIKGVLHKPGHEHPYYEESGCADSDCHKDDLDGGVGEVDGVVVIVPSCFQCHATLWEDDEEPVQTLLFDRIIHQTTSKEVTP